MRSLRHQFVMAGMVIVIITAVVFLLPFAVTSVHAAVSVPRILVLNSYDMGYDWSEAEMAGVRAGLAKAFPRTELFVEYLDTKKFPTKKHFSHQADLLENKYAGQRFDLIIAMDNAALEFALRYRQRISHGTPLVFCGINDYEPSMIAGQSSVTGVAEYLDSVGTLEMALRLHPATTEIIVIHDYTDTGMAVQRELKKEELRFPKLKFKYMEEMPLEETVKKLRSATPGQLVLTLSYTVEKGGRTFLQSEAARLVSRASPVPVYAVHAAQLGAGVVGGSMMEGSTVGEKAAELAARIIGGELPEKLPVVTTNLSRPMFDFRMLEKFGIDPDKLPADAVLINTPPTTLAINKTFLWLVCLFALSSAIGLIILALYIRQKKHFEGLLHAKIDQYRESREELRATEEMLRVQLEAIEDSSRKFKAVFELSPIAVALSTLPEGVFVEVNKAFTEISGYSKEEVIGVTAVDLAGWQHESDRDRFMRMLKSNSHVQNFEVELRHKGGEVLTVLLSGVLLEIGGKSLLLSTIIDISEQRRLQNQLYQSQKMDVVGQLAGGIAHDFNNMLAAIMAAAELLKRRFTGDEKDRKLIEIIISATTRSADLTRELLTFSRKGKAASCPVHIHETIAAVISLLERTIDKKIQLVSRLDGGNPIVMGDQTQLQNALLNLGVNARDAMAQGGTLTYATAVKIMNEAACRSMGITLIPGRYLEITVSDTGAGMTKSVLEHIFEPFFTTKGVGKGTGLGLAAVYGMVKSHGGEICVDSQPGLGSVFKMYLPLFADEPLKQTVIDDVIAGSGGVLLVDDEEMLRSIGGELLKDLGYTVFLAEDGEHALEVFAAHRNEIALVILDMIMPKMGGKEAFMRFRELDPGLKVLFCSGFSQEGTGDELIELGACGFIQKPYNRGRLSRAVAAALVS